ncbi:hypothetical protein ACOME3_003369 [Neoechinorhynchus agilis]
MFRSFTLSSWSSKTIYKCNQNKVSEEVNSFRLLTSSLTFHLFRDTMLPQVKVPMIPSLVTSRQSKALLFDLGGTLGGVWPMEAAFGFNSLCKCSQIHPFSQCRRPGYVPV